MMIIIWVVLLCSYYVCWVGDNNIVGGNGLMEMKMVEVDF